MNLLFGERTMKVREWKKLELVIVYTCTIIVQELYTLSKFELYKFLYCNKKFISLMKCRFYFIFYFYIYSHLRFRENVKKIPTHSSLILHDSKGFVYFVMMTIIFEVQNVVI